MCLLLRIFCLLLLLPRYGVRSRTLVMLAVALILVILVSVITGAILTVTTDVTGESGVGKCVIDMIVNNVSL